MSSRSLNRVMLIGNLTRDPELRYTPNGTAVVTFGLATNRSWLPEGASERREETEFHRIVAWNKLADLCAQLLYKGCKVFVEGRLSTRTFTGSDNQQHTVTEIIIDDMIILDKKGDREARAESRAAYAASQPQAQTPPPTSSPVGSAKTQKTDRAKAEEEVTEEKKKETKTEEKKEEPTANENLNPEDIPF